MVSSNNSPIAHDGAGFAKRKHRHVVACWSLLILLATGVTQAQQVASVPGAEWIARYPNQAYYQGLELYRDGDLLTATEAFQTALDGCLRDTNGLWIDAIPVHAMLGECFYQTGELRQAVTQIEAALSLLGRNRDWLERFDWNSAAAGLALPADERSHWIAENPNTIMALPERLMLTATDPKSVRAAGSRPLLALAARAQLDAIEILRGAAVAGYRRRLILGVLADQTARGSPPPTIAATDQPASLSGLLLNAVDTCHAFAGGQQQTAEDLESLAEREQALHPLTPVLLLAATRLASEQARSAQAAALATRAVEAAGLLGQPEFVAEALLLTVGLGEDDARATGLDFPGVAVSYLRRGRVAAVGALLAASEMALKSDDLGAADQLLNQARAALQRRRVRLPRLAAHGDYLTACLAARRGATLDGARPTEVDEAVQRLLGFARGQPSDPPAASTPRLFQMDLALARSRHRGADPQQSDVLLQRVTRNSPTWLWQVDPVDAISIQAADRAPAVAARLSLALQRDHTADLAALADALLRYRFLAQLPLGGRLQQVRSIASAEPEQLIGAAAELRANAPADFKRLRDAWAQPADSEAEPDTALEALVAQIALRRSAMPEAVPPPLADVSANGGLDEHTGMLVYVDLGERYWGLLILSDQTLAWSLPPNRTLRAEVLAVLRAIGVPALAAGSRLSGPAVWQNEVAKISQRLIPSEHQGAVAGLRRLIIVPDGVLWYLPMELLSLRGDTHGNATAARLGERLAVRYSPTPGWALLPPATASEPQGFVSSPAHPPPLLQWSRLPHTAPQRVILPAHRTAAVDTPLGDGRELFTTLAALRCCGVQEVLVSRWVVGGESTDGLVRELLQELPFTGLRPAWQRSVQLLRRQVLDPQAEPLLTGNDAQPDQVDGEHPLFWSGYLLDAAFDR